MEAMNLNRIIRSLLLFSASFTMFSPISAQIRLAAWAGVHSSNFLEKNSIPGYDTSSGKYYSSNTGFQIGVLAEIPFGKNNFYLQPGILYSAKGNQYSRFYDTAASQSDTLYNQHTLNLNYVEIPVYLTWKLPITRDRKNQFYLSAGPYFAFIYSASQPYQNRIRQYNSQNYIYSSGTEDLPVGSGPGNYKTFDMGIAAKAGFELGSVMIGAYFSRGFTNAYTAGYSSSFHNQVFGGSLGIWLNKTKPLPVIVTDTDKDGTADADDSCKTIPGFPRYHGCPVLDSDHDGINDEEDSCPSVPGLLRYHGCQVPDSDHDGLNDEEDSCRLIFGVEKYHGCPIPDRDGDGVNDEMDGCPDQPGLPENKGCPVVKPTIIARAQIVASNVMFDNNSSRLTKTSYPALIEIADSLKANPNLDLIVEGHTDNTGRTAYNKKLSLERANSVKNVLIEKGVVSTRISVKGFGDTQPVADNQLPAGRAKNRRVVFVFQLKNR